MMIILGEPEENQADWNSQLVHVYNNEQLIQKLKDYNFDQVTKQMFETVKEKMETMEGGFDPRKQVAKKMPTAPIAQWIKEWFQTAEAKVNSEDIAAKIKAIEDDMKVKLKL